MVIIRVNTSSQVHRAEFPPSGVELLTVQGIFATDLPASPRLEVAVRWHEIEHELVSAIMSIDHSV